MSTIELAFLSPNTKSRNFVCKDASAHKCLDDKSAASCIHIPQEGSLTVNCSHDEADLSGVGCASEMGINLLGLVLVQADKAVEDVVACRRVVVTSLVIWEVVLHWRNWKLLLEAIDLVQEQDYRGFDEPSRVANRIEQCECLLHTVDSLVLKKQLIVLRNGDQEEDGGNVLEAVNPLLTFGTLSSDIKHSVCELADNEGSLGDTSGLNTRSQDILVVWHVVVLCDSGNIVEVAKILLVISQICALKQIFCLCSQMSHDCLGM